MREHLLEQRLVETLA